MAINIVVGAQWGDEGKGKIVDYLAERADLIIRYQGGDNAGHTVVNPKGVFKLHLIPCGIFYENCSVLAGTGMVVNPDVLLGEIADMESKGVNTDKLFISEKATVLMPYHIILDEFFEGGKTGIGTTKRGIGHAYADRARRISIRMEDLLDLKYLRERLEQIIPIINKELMAFANKSVELEDMYAKCVYWSEKLGKRIVEPIGFVNSFVDAGKNILFEGQLGVMKDIDLGIFPYVTSSNPTAPYAAVASGIPFQKINDVYGVIKAFSSAVGKGPFPTEMTDEDAAAFRGTGEHVDDEFGARTGRARRIGWLDLPVVKYAADINGFTKLAVCKIDKLDDIDEIKVCIKYKLDGKEIKYMPSSKDLYRVEPEYVTVKGWKEDTSSVREIAKLPKNAREYLALIEKYSGVPVAIVGVGPDREHIAK